MAKQRKVRFKATDLPQIGRGTEQCKGVENRLNEFGIKGCMLLNVALDGNNNRHAVGVFAETPQRWTYKVVQFSMRDPRRAEEQANVLGDDGWIFHAVYSQGANMFATCAVFMKPLGELVEKVAGPEQDSSAVSETADDSFGTESIHVQELEGAAVG